MSKEKSLEDNLSILDTLGEYLCGYLGLKQYPRLIGEDEKNPLTRSIEITIPKEIKINPLDIIGDFYEMIGYSVWEVYSRFNNFKDFMEVNNDERFYSICVKKKNNYYEIFITEDPIGEIIGEC